SLQAGRGVLVVREEWSSEPIPLCVTPGKCPRGQAPQPPLPRIGAGPVRQASRPIAEIGIEYSLRVSLPEHTRLLMLCEAVILCRCLSFPPGLPTSHRNATVWADNLPTTGPLRDLEEKAAAWLLRYLALDRENPIVAFDQFQKTETRT